jgi:hypothetical protein
MNQLIDADKLIKTIVNTPSKVIDKEFPSTEIENYCMTAIADRQKEIIDLIENFPSNNDSWIPADELPEDNVDVLVWFEYYRYGDFNCLYQMHGISYVWDGKWSGFVNGTSGWRNLKIIAWMPLPEHKED